MYDTLHKNVSHFRPPSSLHPYDTVEPARRGAWARGDSSSGSRVSSEGEASCMWKKNRLKLVQC